MKIRLLLATCLTVIAGCGWPFRLGNPDSAHAVIRGHLFAGSGNWDYTVVAVDGRPPIEETIPVGVDEQPGAMVAAGQHRITVSVMPHGRRPTDVPRQVDFVAVVEGGTSYSVGTGPDDVPVLRPMRRN